LIACHLSVANFSAPLGWLLGLLQLCRCRLPRDIRPDRVGIGDAG